MKVRNGFVSNSSSSSFLLAYDKTGVITDAKKIVEYVDNNLRNEIFFKSDLCDGWDIFSLDMHQKNFLLKHWKRFVKYSGGNAIFTDWSGEKDENGNYPTYEAPYVEAFTKVLEFYHYPYEYDRPEVDMSDIPKPDISFEDSIASVKGTSTPEQKARVDAANEWYRVQSMREHEENLRRRDKFLDDTRKKLLEKGADPENLVVELIEVDNDSCDSDGSYDCEFASRYFGLDEDSYFEPVGDPDLENDSEEDT